MTIQLKTRVVRKFTNKPGCIISLLNSFGSPGRFFGTVQRDLKKISFSFRRKRKNEIPLRVNIC
jgi:hypothetical protein